MKNDIISQRMTIVAFCQAVYANPNGDPDMGNLPRIDVLTNNGIISADAIKSHLRSYVLSRFNDADGYEILHKAQTNVNEELARTINHANLAPDSNAKRDRKETATQTLSGGKSIQAAKEMCKRFYDVRVFGGVLSTGANAGQVRGPVQVSIAQSCSPVEPVDMTITRKSYAQATKGHELDMAEFARIAQMTDDSAKRTMGNRQYIPYGLYMLPFQINPCDAEKTGMTEGDLQILLDGIANMFEIDASSTKMGMSTLLPIIVFKHVGTDSDASQRANQAKLGCAPLYRLMDLIRVTLKDGVEAPRSLSDYDITVNVSGVYSGVEIGFKNDFYGEVQYHTKGSIPPFFHEMRCV